MQLTDWKWRVPSMRPEIIGFGVSIAANALIIIVAVTAARFNFLIALVVNSPSRYSVIVVPFALAAVIAAAVSFLQYGRYTRTIAFLGIFTAGCVTTLFFWPFPEDRSTLIRDYLERLDQIGVGILAFSLLALTGSIRMYFHACGRQPPKGNKAPEHQKDFWRLKGLVCDLPIVIGAILLLWVQRTQLEASHQQYTEILFGLIGNERNALASPEFFRMEEVQRQLGIANFWIGVSMGVMSAQLVAQQLGTLALEWVFWFRDEAV
jgi:hypothetical protein